MSKQGIHRKNSDDDRVEDKAFTSKDAAQAIDSRKLTSVEVKTKESSKVETDMNPPRIVEQSSAITEEWIKKIENMTKDELEGEFKEIKKQLEKSEELKGKSKEKVEKIKR